MFTVISSVAASGGSFKSSFIIPFVLSATYSFICCCAGRPISTCLTTALKPSSACFMNEGLGLNFGASQMEFESCNLTFSLLPEARLSLHSEHILEIKGQGAFVSYPKVILKAWLVFPLAPSEIRENA